ncbi:MAG: MotA/TolQ/ExbB proton channel family protein [Planctomycetaceae bacterium]|nr:MotA/TolQ/ExbB proton channel family protein [Planctomycetaceae bacterium]
MQQSSPKYNAASPMLRTQERGGIYQTLPAIAAGLGFTVVFYLVAPMIPGTQSFVQRYFCGHPLEFVSSTMFFLGMALLGAKLLRLPAERQQLAVGRQLLSDIASDTRHEPGSPEAVRAAAVRMQRNMAELPERVRHTMLCRRLDDTLHYLDSCPGGRLEDHLRYLAELSIDRLQQSYSVLRTIAWAIPIIGFLGTVIGITMAIANITPEQLDSSLTTVSAGLAVAFDTTAQALGMSLVLVFASFFMERGEQSVLNDVEQFGIDHLLPRLSTDTESVTRTDRVSIDNDSTLALIQQDIEHWRTEMTDMRTRWTEFVTEYNQELTDSLRQEMAEVLEVHRAGSETARSAYASALADGATTVTHQLEGALNQFSSRMDQWQQILQQSVAASAAQSEQLHGLGRTLLQLQESEERLSHLQKQMNEGVQSARIVETLEQSVSTLTAAINFMSAKTNARHAA